MDCKIRKQTLRSLERAENAILRVGVRESNRLKKTAVKLLNKFQRRVKARVEFVSVSGNFWLGCDLDDDRVYRELSGALADVANPSCPGSFESQPRRPSIEHARRYQERIMKLFPELLELWWIAYELDAMPGRPGLPGFFPTVLPRGQGRKRNG